MSGRTAGLALLVCAWGASTLPAGAKTILDAVPTIKIETAAEGAARSLLSESERQKYRVTIVRRDGRYVWSSREGRELIHHVSGAFHYFIDPRGGGYVKVFDAAAVPDSLRDRGARFRYMEHLSLWLGTVTYWGESEHFYFENDPLGIRDSPDRGPIKPRGPKR